MFEFFKNLFGSRPAEDGVSSEIEAPAPRPAPTPSTSFRSRSATAAPPPQANPKANCILIPLQSVIESLPLEFKGRVQQMDLTGATLTISMDRVMSQLQTGAVKLAFGELRHAAPQLFSPENDLDQVPVPLPLSEILPRIHPGMLLRRGNQKQLDVPPEISSPFGDRGQGLIFSAGPARPSEAAAPARATTPGRPVQPKPGQPSIPPVPAIPQRPVPVQPAVRPPIKPAAPLSAPAARNHVAPPAPPTPISAPQAPISPIAPQAPISPITAKAPISPIAPPAPAAHAPQAPVAPPTPPAPVVPPTPVAPPPPIPMSPALRNLGAAIAAAPSNGTPASHAPAPVAAKAPVPSALPDATPAAPAAPAKPPSTETVLLPIGLGIVAESWPDALKQEILGLNLVDARLAVPADLIEESLKRGRVAFPWKTVRSWIKPAIPASVSAHDGTVVELPLKLIMPLFLARHKAQKEEPKAQVAIDESIPNLFFGFPQADESPFANNTAAPATPSQAVTKPLETNYYVWDDNADSALVDETEFKRKPSPETSFITRCATPNEVVSRAAALEGVCGALVALPDGLMVASKLSPELNGDTLAAFLPQIFGKVSQCTKELRMGELNNLNFTVGNVPWKIFRVNAIYFAAFGRVGQGLPTAQLSALAAELDHRKQ